MYKIYMELANAIMEAGKSMDLQWVSGRPRRVNGKSLSLSPTSKAGKDRGLSFKTVKHRK